jgi:hypothetical protein
MCESCNGNKNFVSPQGKRVRNLRIRKSVPFSHRVGFGKALVSTRAFSYKAFARFRKEKRKEDLRRPGKFQL